MIEYLKLHQQAMSATSLGRQNFSFSFSLKISKLDEASQCLESAFVSLWVLTAKLRKISSLLPLVLLEKCRQLSEIPRTFIMFADTK